MAIPVAIAYSPKTQTDGITAIAAAVIVIDDTVNEGISSFPVASVAAPGVAVLSVNENFNSEDPADYETVTYTERHDASKELRGVTREVEGTAREWPDETWIASYTSAAAWNEMRGDVVGLLTDVTDLGTDKVDKAGDTMSGELGMQDNVVSRPKIKDYGETAVIATAVNGAVTIDLVNGNVIRHTLSDAVTYTFSNPPASGTAGSFTLIVEQPAAAKVITWPASVKWPDDAAPDDPGNSKVAIYTFITTDAGARWYGFQAGTGFVI